VPDGLALQPVRFSVISPRACCCILPVANVRPWPGLTACVFLHDTFPSLFLDCYRLLTYTRWPGPTDSELSYDVAPRLSGLAPAVNVFPIAWSDSEWVSPWCHLQLLAGLLPDANVYPMAWSYSLCVPPLNLPWLIAGLLLDANRC
jgi:hypothetical protein